MKRVCVYGGSRWGTRPEYADAARDLARALADRDLGLVNGGGGVGLMDVMANEVLALGVLPDPVRRRL